LCRFICPEEVRLISSPASVDCIFALVCVTSCCIERGYPGKRFVFRKHIGWKYASVTCVTRCNRGRYSRSSKGLVIYILVCQQKRVIPIYAGADGTVKPLLSLLPKEQGQLMFHIIKGLVKDELISYRPLSLNSVGSGELPSGVRQIVGWNCRWCNCCLSKIYEGTSYHKTCLIVKRAGFIAPFIVSVGALKSQPLNYLIRDSCSYPCQQTVAFSLPPFELIYRAVI